MNAIENTIQQNYRAEECIAPPPRGNSRETISSYDQLPVALNANQVAAALGISRAGAYNLMRSEGFPTLFIGKRMVVPKDRLLNWIQSKTAC